jgi:DNA-binding SARP family transcriptional activator
MIETEHRVSECGQALLVQQPRRSTDAGLRVYALGRLRIYYDQAVLQFPTKKTQHLLCFLLLRAGERLERDLVAERLWPVRPPGKARRCLSTTLWRLRQTLESVAPSDPPYLLVEHGTLAFNTAAPYWYDVAAFEKNVSFGLSGIPSCAEQHCRALEDALDLYGGDLLDDTYDDWCLSERERLRLLHLRVLRELQCHYRRCRAFEKAIACGHRLLALDPLQEDVWRELMRCYVDAGQRPMALEQFQRCRDMLRRELKIEPMPETRELYRQIRAGQEGVRQHGAQPGQSVSLQAALAQLRRALDALESTWQALQAATIEFTEESQSSHNEIA